MENPIITLQKTERVLENNAKAINIFDVPQNAKIDTNLYLPVFDFRDETSENPSVIYIENFQDKTNENAQLSPISFGRNPIDTFDTGYGFFPTGNRFRFAQSWVVFTDYSGWYFYDGTFPNRKFNSQLQFGVNCAGSSVCVLRFNIGQTIDRLTIGPTWITIKIGSRSINVDAMLHNNSFFEVATVLAIGQTWFDVSVTLDRTLNLGHHPFSVLSVQLFDSMQVPVTLN